MWNPCSHVYLAFLGKSTFTAYIHSKISSRSLVRQAGAEVPRLKIAGAREAAGKGGTLLVPGRAHRGVSIGCVPRYVAYHIVIVLVRVDK